MDQLSEIYIDVAVSVYVELAVQQELSRSRDSALDPNEQLESAAVFAFGAAGVFTETLKKINEGPDS